MTGSSASDLFAVLTRLRLGGPATRPTLARELALGRSVVAQRIEDLTRAGIVREDGIGASTGGRAPHLVRFREEAGIILMAELGATSLAVGHADLTGRLLSHVESAADVTRGPIRTLEGVATALTALIRERNLEGHRIFGVGVGVPGPVEFASGRPVSPPLMPGWDGFRIREELSARFDAPVWVDNDVNLLALGELSWGAGRGFADLLYVKMGTGIGAGLITKGRLHRGAQGCSGDIGHVVAVEGTDTVCRCGQTGCLEALAGGDALARQALAAASDPRASHLPRLLAEGRGLTSRTVATAASHGDPVAIDLLASASRLIAETLATLVNFFNPGIVVLGGGIAHAGDLVLATIRETIYQRSLPLATRDLRIITSDLGDRGALMGAAVMVIDEVFKPEGFGLWFDQELAHRESTEMS